MRSNDRWIVESVQVRSNGTFQNLISIENTTNGNGTASDGDNKAETMDRSTETIPNDANRSPFGIPATNAQSNDEKLGNEDEPHIDELNELWATTTIAQIPYAEESALSEGSRVNQRPIAGLKL